MTAATIIGLVMAAVGLLEMVERGRRAFGAAAFLLGGLVLAAWGAL